MTNKQDIMTEFENILEETSILNQRVANLRLLIGKYVEEKEK